MVGCKGWVRTKKRKIDQYRCQTRWEEIWEGWNLITCTDENLELLWTESLWFNWVNFTYLTWICAYVCACMHSHVCGLTERRKEDPSCSNSALCLLCLLVNAHALGFVDDENYSFPSSQSQFSRKVHIQGMQKTSTEFWNSPHPWSIGVNVILFVFSHSLPDIPHLLSACIESMPSHLSPYRIFKAICLARRTRNCFQLWLVLHVAFLLLSYFSFLFLDYYDYFSVIALHT